MVAQQPAQGPSEASVPAQGQISAQPPSQNPAQTPDQAVSSPSLKLNPLEVLRRFEPPPNEEYRLGKGDEITVDFAGRPEMQAKLVVGPDGSISLPLAGEVKIAGLTRTEAANTIEAALTATTPILNPRFPSPSTQPTACCFWARSIMPGRCDL